MHLHHPRLTPVRGSRTASHRTLVLTSVCLVRYLTVLAITFFFVVCFGGRNVAAFGWGGIKEFGWALVGLGCVLLSPRHDAAPRSTNERPSLTVRYVILLLGWLILLYKACKRHCQARRERRAHTSRPTPTSGYAHEGQMPSTTPNLWGPKAKAEPSFSHRPISLYDPGEGPDS